MRILLDHNTPAPLRYSLQGHQVETAYERGWAVLSNGDLLSAAESAGFDLMITTDKGIRHQQNLAGRKLSLLVIDTNDWTRIRRSQALIVARVSSLRPGEYAEVQIPFP
jgi:predicted nuclease of predicted toxin-antitoxin system